MKLLCLFVIDIIKMKINYSCDNDLMFWSGWYVFCKWIKLGGEYLCYISLVGIFDCGCEK